MNSKHCYLQDFHFVKGSNDTNVLFHHPTYTLFELNDDAFNIANALSKSDITEVSFQTGLREDELKELIRNIKSNIDNSSESKTCEEGRKVSRITLHVTNDCNLRCKYCYAKGGNYDEPRSLMSMSTADKFISFCKENFTDVQNIVFFGGEPLLNIKVMEFICDKFNSLYSEKQISFLPKFGLITNGTILTERVNSFVNKNISFVTVSIDGPKEINDKNRVYSNGNGSYDSIVRFISELKKNKALKLRFEATFTKEHLLDGFTKEDIYSYLRTKFNIHGEVINELSLDNSQLPFQGSKYDLNNLENLPEGFLGILHSISKKKPISMCQISNRIFSVSTMGYIYPCHIVTGQKSSCLGNIHSRNIFNTPEEYELSFPLHKIISNRKLLCKDCWAQNICGGCSIKWFYNKENRNFQTEPRKEICSANKKHIEKILLLIAKIRKDKYIWPKLLKLYNEN